MKIGKNKDLVKSLLASGGTEKVFRNNDNKLIAMIWHKLLEKGGINSKEITGWN